MSETTLDNLPSTSTLPMDTDGLVRVSGVVNEDDETWIYENNVSRNPPMIDHSITAPSIDQEVDARETVTIIPSTNSLVGNLFDDESDDDDEIQVTIGNYELETSTFQNLRPKGRTMLTGTETSVIPSKSTAVRGVDFDAQGVINGQPTYEHDINSAYKDDEKPWKKPGADVTDYFNYGFTEEVWVQYCDRQRRLRSENSLARLNGSHIPQMSPMLPGHPSMGHPINPHQYMMMNKPMNMPMMLRPMHARRPDGRIDVIGTTDQTSRRPMFETPPNFEHAPFINGSSFPGNQSSNGPTVGDLISTPPSSSSPSPSHGTPVAGTHHISTVGGQHLPMMSLPHGMPFRPRFTHPNGLGGPHYFPRGLAPGMHGDRPPQPYFIPRHPQQPWGDKNGIPLVHGFPPGPFPPPATGGDGRTPYNRSPTPEERSAHSSTPEEHRTSTTVDNGKSSKDDRYKDRYRDDHDRHTSSRRQGSSKDRSSSSHRPRHRSGDHDYERLHNERRSSRDRDKPTDRSPRKRSHRDDSARHHQHSSHRTPTETASLSLPTPSESFQTSNEFSSVVTQPTPSSSPVTRSRRDESERSSSRHSHHKKSSKRSRGDSDNDDERSRNSHRRRSKERSTSRNKKTDESK